MTLSVGSPSTTLRKKFLHSWPYSSSRIWSYSMMTALISIPTQLPLLSLVCLVVPAYLIVVRMLRFRRMERMQKKFKYQNKDSLATMTIDDAYSILIYLAELEFPLAPGFGLFIALFKSYGIPNMSKLLVATGGFASPMACTKRGVDTAVLMIDMVLNHPTSDRSLDAMTRINYLHSGYQKNGQIQNSDMLYTLGLFAREPVRWLRKWEWRDLSDMEVCALGVIWKNIGDMMLIPYNDFIVEQPQNGLEWMQHLDSWCTTYEKLNMIPSASNHELATNLMAITFWDLPWWLKDLGQKCATVLLGSRLQTAMMLPKPTRHHRRFVYTFLSVRKFCLRYLALPRPDWMRVRAVDEEPHPETGRFYTLIWAVRPWYIRSSRRFSLEGWFYRLIGRPLPGDGEDGNKWHSQGYHISEVGPTRQRDKGLDFMQEAKQRIKQRNVSTGQCPFAASAPSSLLVDGQTPSEHPGWVSAPNLRGTMDILWSCISTLFLNIWVMLHLNVPAKSDKFWTKVWRKARWFIMSLLAPEFMVLMAYDQLTSARQSVTDMRKSGYRPPAWTLTHAYYTDMGGFLLHEPQGGLSFPVSAKQLRYLVDHQYLQIPNTSESEVWDKSKADKFAKAIVLIQTIWFLTETVARAVQHLPITPIEIETLAVICVTLVTFGLWYNKPKDVEEPIDIYLKVSVAEVLRRAGDEANLPFRDTPLDFAEPPFHISSIWNDDVLRWILRRGLQTRPLDRMPNDNNPRHNTLLGHVAMMFILIVFVGLPFANWNFTFPTRCELILWRVNIIVVAATLAMHFVTEQRNAGLSKPYFRDGEDYKQNWLKSLLFLIPGAINLLARLCLVSLCLSSLRELPAEAFVTVQWTSFIPHI